MCWSQEVWIGEEWKRRVGGRWFFKGGRQIRELEAIESFWTKICEGKVF